MRKIFNISNKTRVSKYSQKFTVQKYVSSSRNVSVKEGNFHIRKAAYAEAQGYSSPLRHKMMILLQHLNI